MQLIIDRMEGDTAMVELEDGRVLPFPAQLCEALGAGEGSVLTLTHDANEGQRRKEESGRRLKKLFKKSGE